MIDITYPDFKSAPPGILRDQDGDLLVKRDIDHAVWLQTSGHWRTIPRTKSAWYHGVIGAVAPFRLVAPLPAELTDEALRAAAEGKTAERVEPCPEVGDRLRPEDLARLPVGAVVDTRDGTGAPLLVRGLAGWGWGNACKGERLPDSPQWGNSISSGAMSRQVGDKAVLVGLGLEGARGRAFDEGLAAQGYQPAIAALAGAGAAAAAAARPFLLGVGVDLMWYLRPEATREARWRALSGTGLDVLAVVCAFECWDWPGLPEVDTCGRLAESEAAWDAAATAFAGHKGAAGDFIRPLEEERAELARLRARLARHRRNREMYGRTS